MVWMRQSVLLRRDSSSHGIAKWMGEDAAGEIVQYQLSGLAIGRQSRRLEDVCQIEVEGLCRR